MRDADAPLDSEMLGLEERMGDVVDVRPDRFLREMREHGDWNKACQTSGMTVAELNTLCRENIKFDRAFVECHLQYLEDTTMAAARKRVKDGRALAYKQLAERHG
jgi:hypothetical protein